MSQTTVSAQEVARFDALSARWWDPEGPMKPLHRMNPVRIDWIDERIRRRYPDPRGVRLLELGCGAGLAAEALARRGYTVLGVDAATDAIAAGQAHVERRELALTYRCGLAEDLLREGQRFPVITVLEVIEHVPDPAAFVRVVAGLLEPHGMLFLSTLNRTIRSLLMAKIGAEYVLRLLPVGTHDWRRFIRPSELGGMLRRAGMRVADTAGLVMDPLTGRWRVSRDVGVNYLMQAEG